MGFLFKDGCIYKYILEKIKYIKMAAPKDKMFSLRIPEKLLNEYREFCEENSINISMRLRKFIERDLESWRIKKIQQRKNNTQS